jgi:hypothetical protein
MQEEKFGGLTESVMSITYNGSGHPYAGFEGMILYQGNCLQIYVLKLNANKPACGCPVLTA